MTSQRLSEMLRRANQVMAASYAAHAPGITIPQAEILRALIKNGPLYQRRITEETGIDRSTLSDSLQRMKDRLLIACVRHDADGRAILVTITHAGRAALVKADDADRAAELAVMKSIDRLERRPFRDCLETIAGSAT